MDLEELKKDADALGVKYRADIKAEALQSKIDKQTKPVKLVKEPEYKDYKNTGNINVFTEAGRCRPGGIVSLTKDEADQYKALECQD